MVLAVYLLRFVRCRWLREAAGADPSQGSRSA
jgi:hypothetical protein